jgi:uncharacterized protein (TIGR00730 family)
MQRVCVYCASSSGIRPDYSDAARALATELIARNIELVYGGSSVGVMGSLANAMLEHGGIVHGVIPEVLIEKEVSHDGLTKLHVVGSMHERKSLMESLSDAFIALPGGFGTLEELVEILTWGQLHLHSKPVGILNVAGYYDGLLTFLDHAVAEGLLNAASRAMLQTSDSPAGLLDLFETYKPPGTDKWQ